MSLYLSRVFLNPLNRAAAQNLSRPYELHRTMLRAFPSADRGGPGRVLFRTEPMERTGKPAATVLVQSETVPDWAEAARLFPRGLLLEPPQCKEVPTGFQIGTVLQFRLRANPTMRRVHLSDGTRDERKQRPRHGIYRSDDQVSWLVRQGSAHGFHLVSQENTSLRLSPELSDRYQVIIRDEGTISTGKKTESGGSRHYSVLFEGRLCVTQTDLFREALRGGIGPGKAFGFGLLSVAPCSLSP